MLIRFAMSSSNKKPKMLCGHLIREGGNKGLSEAGRFTLRPWGWVRASQWEEIGVAGVWQEGSLLGKQQQEMGSMAQGEAREQVGSGLDPKSRGIHGRTTSRGVAWGNLPLGVVHPHIGCCFWVTGTDIYPVMQGCGQACPFLFVSAILLGVILCVTPIIQHNYNPLKVKDTVFTPSVVHGACVVLGPSWVTGQQSWSTDKALDLMKRDRDFRPQLPLTSCETSEVKHTTFLSFCFLVYKKGKPYAFYKVFMKRLNRMS